MAGPGQLRVGPSVMLWLPLLVVLTVSELVEGITHHFLDVHLDYCHAGGVRRIVTESLRVDLSRNPLMFRQKDFVKCTLTLLAPKGFRLVLTVSNFHIKQKNSNACRNRPTRYPCSYVMISNYKSPLGLTEKMTGTWRNRDVVSNGRALLIHYQGCPRYDTLTMTVTAYRGPSSEGTCLEDEYLCHGNMNMCIPFTLVCNGENNCGVGNINDETNVLCRNDQNTEKPETSTKRPVGLIGALGGILITGSLMAVFAITLCVLRKRRQREAEAPAPIGPCRAAGKAVPNEYLPLPVPPSKARDHQTLTHQSQSEWELLVPPRDHNVSNRQSPVADVGTADDVRGDVRHFVDPTRGHQPLVQSRRQQVPTPVPLQSTGPTPPPRPDIEHSAKRPLYVNIPGESTPMGREHFLDVDEEQQYVNVPQGAAQHYVNIPELRL